MLQQPQCCILAVPMSYVQLKKHIYFPEKCYECIQSCWLCVSKPDGRDTSDISAALFSIYRRIQRLLHVAFGLP